MSPAPPRWWFKGFCSLRAWGLVLFSRRFILAPQPVMNWISRLIIGDALFETELYRFPHRYPCLVEHRLIPHH
jgi:hypothetical protein